MDVHIPAAITRGLRRRGVDVLTAQEDATTLYSDADLLDRAGEPDRLLFSMDVVWSYLQEQRRKMTGRGGSSTCRFEGFPVRRESSRVKPPKFPG